jgi:4-diphosphocytidyl-2-C-methyl-D-erythritol kinase
LPALRFRLDKDIPVAAGLGGGSADAAAALELAAGVWGVDLGDPRLGGIGARLGADVPFCLSRADAAHVGGIGEVVHALPAPDPPAGVVLVTSSTRLSTAAVFAELDRGSSIHATGRPGVSMAASPPLAAGSAVAATASALAAGADASQVAELAPSLRDANDLWPAASTLLAALVPLRTALEHALGRPCLLSGSGPTLVALYPSPRDASLAASRLAADPPWEARGARIIATSTSAPGGTS